MPAPGSFPSYTSRLSLGRRATAFVVAVAINVLLLVMLMTLAPHVTAPPPPNRNPITFDLSPDPAHSDSSRTTRQARRERAAAAPSRRPAPEPAPPKPEEQAEQETAPPPLNMLVLSREDFAAADIGSMRLRRGDGGAKAQGPAQQQAGSDESVGTGPGGERLYPADWFRRPTRAELSYYLPAGLPENAWGVIACQTAPRNRVENCRELGDSPAGSGLARAVREAAWQFQVLAPRVNGRPQIGAWVRIRIDIVRGQVEARGGAGPD